MKEPKKMPSLLKKNIIFVTTLLIAFGILGSFSAQDHPKANYF
jgi:hypothetical protein